MSELLGLPEPAVALSTRGLVRCSLGDPAGLEDCRRAEAAAQAQGLGIERSTIMINHSNLRFLMDGAEASREAVSDTLAFVTSHGLAMHAGACQSSLIHCAYEQGEWDEALGRIEAALPELERLENQWDLLFLRALQALVFSARGEPASAGSFLEWLIDRGAVSEVGWSRGYALLSAGAVLCAGGESAKAGELLRACFEQPQAASAIVEALPEALRTALVVGDEELPARLMLELESVPPASRLPLQWHVLSSCDALLEERRGRHEAAAQRFENAAASWGEFGVPYEEAHALLGQGRCLMALDRAQEAARPLQQAREIFARLGAKPALVEVDRVLGEIPQSPR
jgi:tetratricopeptide (TPR) repeat protein